MLASRREFLSRSASAAGLLMLAGAPLRALESLQTVAHRLAEAMYKNAAASGGDGDGQAPGGPPGGKDEGVIDAEFEETT